MLWKILSSTLLIALFLCSCRNKTPDKDQGREVSIPMDFYDFYEKFHVDSLYQMQHILFPLEGIPATDSLRNDRFRWTAEEWRLHRPFDDMGGTFSRSLYDINSVIIEKISDQSGAYTMERRWVKMGEDWTMIYYKEMGR